MALIKQYYINGEYEYSVKVKVHLLGEKVTNYKYIKVTANEPQQAYKKAKEIIKAWGNVGFFQMLYIENLFTGEIT